MEDHLPADLLIPNLTLEEVLTAGVQALRPRGVPLLGPEGVYEEIERMLTERQPYALVRLGDGELLTMAQDIVLPADEVRKAGHFLSYAGVDVPDLRARDEVAAAFRIASRIGVPLSRRPHYQPLLFALWNAFGIQAEELPLTFSTINYALYEQGYLNRLMAGRRLLLIGNVAPPLAQVLLAQGVQVVGTVSPVQGINDLHRVVEEAAAYDFDLALVAAGIAAVPICVHLAGRTGKVAIDIGHQANIVAGVRGSFVRREEPDIRS
ncbi:Succinyl-CoA synthetase [Cohnella lubricantis]